MTQPLAELAGHITWSMYRDFFYGTPAELLRPVSLCIGFAPEFPEANPSMREAGIVWDLLALAASCRQPGGHDLLNCGCGYPSDAGIEQPVFVSHPNAETIVWEMDVAGLQPALAPAWAGKSGFLRLTFPRPDYAVAIRGMVRLARAADSAELPVDEFEPNERGDAWERLLALDMETALVQGSPLLPPRTVLEFGFAGQYRCFMNGVADRNWAPRLFTRWEVHAAFERWTDFVQRGYALADSRHAAMMSRPVSGAVKRGHENDFFLVDASLRSACDEAGEEFVRLLRAAFAEGATAPDVEVKYRPSRAADAYP